MCTVSITLRHNRKKPCLLPLAELRSAESQCCLCNVQWQQHRWEQWHSPRGLSFTPDLLSSTGEAFSQKGFSEVVPEWLQTIMAELAFLR